MGSRDRAPDREGASGEGDGNGYPLLFRDESRSSRRGLLARILEFFREPPDDPGRTGADAPVPLDQGSSDPPEPVRRPDPAWPPAPGERDVPEAVHPPEEPGIRPAEAGPSAHAEGTRRAEETPETPEATPEQPPEAPEQRREAREPPREARPTPPVHRTTLQMLPGRLVPVDRARLRQEIRFLRPPEPGRETTLGWAGEDPPEHVTIDHPSVERHHAGMRYRRGHWWIRSLSPHDPVLLNGRPVEVESGPRHLKDGDRVRLGEIDFRFRLP